MKETTIKFIEELLNILSQEGNKNDGFTFTSSVDNDALTVIVTISRCKRVFKAELSVDLDLDDNEQEEALQAFIEELQISIKAGLTAVE